MRKQGRFGAGRLRDAAVRAGPRAGHTMPVRPLRPQPTEPRSWL